MKTIALITAFAASAATLIGTPQENTKFPADRHAALAAMLAAD